MIHFDIGSALTAITLLLAITSLSLLAFGHLGLGMVVAFIGAGILLGQFTDLPQGAVNTLREATEFGVVLLLFLIGVELEPKELNRLGRDVAIWGTAQILFTGLLIGIYAWLVVGKLNASIIIGLGFALSSTTLVIQMLKDRGSSTALGDVRRWRSLSRKIWRLFHYYYWSRSWQKRPRPTRIARG